MSPARQGSPAARGLPRVAGAPGVVYSDAVLRSVAILAAAGWAGCTPAGLVHCGGAGRGVYAGGRPYCLYEDTAPPCPPELGVRLALSGAVACTDARASDETICRDLGRGAGCVLSVTLPPDGGVPDGALPDGALPDGALPDGGPPPAQASCGAPGATPGCGLVFVPGGSFEMGQLSATNGEVVGRVSLSRHYWVDAYEVTVARFQAFVDAGLPVPPVPVPVSPGREIDMATATVSLPGTVNALCTWDGADPALPVNCVGFWTALAFCAWDGGRLPTEAEWEYVARGRSVGALVSGRTYPWGGSPPTCDLARYEGCGGARGPAPVGAPAGRGAGGVFDLAGNVAEWTLDAWAPMAGECWPPDPPTVSDPFCDGGGADRVTRGGHYSSNQFDIRSASRATGDPDLPEYGFRCIRPAG